MKYTFKILVVLSLLTQVVAACAPPESESSSPTDSGVAPATPPPYTAVDSGSSPATNEGWSDPPACQVQVTEINYNPAPGLEGEFLELTFSGQWQGRAIDECGVNRISLRSGDHEFCPVQEWPEIELPDEPIPTNRRFVIGTTDAPTTDWVIDAPDLIEDRRPGLIVLLDNDDQPLQTLSYGGCQPTQSCLDKLGLASHCAPTDPSSQGLGLSLCADNSTLQVQPLSPGNPNPCPCEADCGALEDKCQEALCTPQGCAVTSAKDGTACNDDNPCTYFDQCLTGSCAGQPVSCPMIDPCRGVGACDPSLGECVYLAGCGEHAHCEGDLKDAQCVCDPGFKANGDQCEDVDECLEQTDLCHPDANCTNQLGSYDCTCPEGTWGNGINCTPDCVAGCPWESDPCSAPTALLEIAPLDIWAQLLKEPQISAERISPSPAPHPLQGDVVPVTSLCGPMELWVTVSAPDHEPLQVQLNYDGQGGAQSLTISQTAGDPQSAYLLSEDIRLIDGTQSRVYTLWSGLTHHWFAPTGPPARHGNLLTLMMNGGEMWESVFIDLLAAESLVTMQSWWWTSELELIREGLEHIYLPEDERWANSVMGALEALAGPEIKVLVNQFFNEEGLLSGITLDGELTAKAETPGDNFEFMGISNWANGSFTIQLPAVDFAERAQTTWLEAAEGAVVDSQGLPPFHPPIDVDMSALPLGLSVFDVPHSSWHQKGITIDQEVAYVSGINTKTTDWDTSTHDIYDYRRMEFSATVAQRLDVLDQQEHPDFGPRKDYGVRIEGPSVTDVSHIFWRGWQMQLWEDAPYANLSTGFDLAPPSAPLPGGVQAQVLSTMPPPFEDRDILETLLRAIQRAEEYIFIEDQYFRAPLLHDAIAERMLARPDLVLIVVTNPVNEWLDPGCWQTYLATEKLSSLFPERFRIYELKNFHAFDSGCTLCWDEFVGEFVPVFIHSKLVLIDGVYLQVGSSNNNHRSLLYEAEMAIAVYDSEWVSNVQNQILSHLLGDWYTPPSSGWDLWWSFEIAASGNDYAQHLWEEEGMDLDLDGAPLPQSYIPQGLLYTLPYDDPDECLIEGVGEDVT